VKLVRARFGENLDSPVAEFVVLRGKRVLIDADFADGSFGRERAARKSVDVNLAAVRASRRASKRLQFGLQFVGIIGKFFEILPCITTAPALFEGAISTFVEESETSTFSCST